MLREALDTTCVQEQIKALDTSIQAKAGDKVIDKHVNLGLDLSKIPTKDLIELHSLCQEDDTVPLDWEPLESDSSKPDADDYTTKAWMNIWKPKTLSHLQGS